MKDTGLKTKIDLQVPRLRRIGKMVVPSLIYPESCGVYEHEHEHEHELFIDIDLVAL